MRTISQTFAFNGISNPLKRLRIEKIRPVFKLKVFVLFLIAIVQTTLLFGQDTVKVKLDKLIMTNEIPRVSTPILFYDNISHYKGIEYSMDSLCIGRVVLNREQYWFDQSKLKDSLNSYYLKSIEDNNIITENLSQNPLKTYISILVKIKNGKKIVIADANNNYDFSDDDVNIFAFRTEKSFYDNYQNVNSFLVRYEKFQNNEVKNHYINLKLKPFDSAFHFRTKIDSIRSIYFSPNNYFVGKLKVDNEDFLINIVKNRKLDFEDKPFYFQFSLVPSNQKIRSYDWVRFNQSFKINNNIFEIVELQIDEQIVSIKTRPATKNDYGWSVGEYLPENILKDYFSSNYKNRKYNIANFWGSWCGPCIQEIPDIITFNKNNSDLINLVNIACEYNPAGINKAKEIINKNKMEWNQFYSINGEENSLNKLLNVTNFPTLIVFDNRGKIVAREIGLGNIDIIKEKFKLN